jgi:hypothetical protein
VQIPLPPTAPGRSVVDLAGQRRSLAATAIAGLRWCLYAPIAGPPACVARIEGGRKGRRLCWCLPRCGREGRYEDQGGRGAAEVFSREGGREGGGGVCGSGRRRELGFSLVLIRRICGLLTGRRADQPKIVTCPCRATVSRVRPRPGPTIGSCQPEASCRAVLGLCFFEFEPFPCRSIGPEPSGHLYLPTYPDHYENNVEAEQTYEQKS